MLATAPSRIFGNEPSLIVRLPASVGIMIFSIIRTATRPFAVGRASGRKLVFDSLGAFAACNCRRATMAIIRGRAFLMPYENVGSRHLEEAPLALTNVRFEGNKGT